MGLVCQYGLVEAPAGVPLQFQILDENGMSRHWMRSAELPTGGVDRPRPAIATIFVDAKQVRAKVELHPLHSAVGVSEAVGTQRHDSE